MANAGGGGEEDNGHNDPEDSLLDRFLHDGPPEDEEEFDITISASHSYMGPGLVALGGRRVVEAGWAGRVPAAAHRSVVFPGETVPMLLPNPEPALTEAILNERLFALIFSRRDGPSTFGYGVLCEVFEVGVPGPQAPQLTFKARATDRCRARHLARDHSLLRHYLRMQWVDVVVLPEVKLPEPLAASRLASLDPHRPPPTLLDKQLRLMEAAGTPWPLFVYNVFDFARIRRRLRDFFASLKIENVPEEPVALSFWVASNLSLSARDQLALFAADCALQRLHMEITLINKKCNLHCESCLTEIAKCDDLFPMSSEGVHSNYTNLSGYMHDIMTVYRASNTALGGAPSAEYSWFPGYTWTVLVCAACTEHVGWRFDAMKRNLRPQQFYGLTRSGVRPRAAGGGGGGGGGEDEGYEPEDHFATRMALSPISGADFDD